MSDPVAEGSRNVRPSSAPLTRGSKYVPSPSPVDPFIVMSKQFDFSSSTLSQIGTAGNAVGVITTSRLPTNYTLPSGPLRAVSHPHQNEGGHLHRGSSNVQSSFFEKLTGQYSYAKKRSVDDELAAAARQQESVAHNVAERLVEMQNHRQAVQRRIRPTSAVAQRTVDAGLQISKDAGTSQQSPTRAHRLQQRSTYVLADGGHGFDGRMAVVKAAQSACLSAAPHSVSSPSARKGFYDVEVASRAQTGAIGIADPPLGEATVDVAAADESSLMLRHRRTELMLASAPPAAAASDASSPPLLGAGMRALLLASQDNVQSVASGVLLVAQVLGEDIQAQHQRQQSQDHHSHLVPTAGQPFYKDLANPAHGGGGESWRIIYSAGQPKPSAHSPTASAAAAVAAAVPAKLHGSMFGDQGSNDFSADGSSLMPSGEILNGSAVRIRGRPHTAPLTRGGGGGRDSSNTKPIDYLAEMRADRPSSAAKKRPSSATHMSSPHVVKHAGNAVARPYSAASIRPSNVYVLDPERDMATKPVAPEWLDHRGLIGVSVDPRYNHQAPPSFPHLGGIDGGLSGVGGFGAGEHAKHHDSRFTHFRSGTALSAIREARVRRDAAQLAQRKGILRGGAGFLMFSSAGDSK